MPSARTKYLKIAFVAGAGAYWSAALMQTGCSAASVPANAQIDPMRTQITFDVNSAGLGVTHGVFRRFRGKLDVDLKRPQRSSVLFVVDASSIFTGSSQLDDYIRSALFEVARFPEMEFHSSYVHKVDGQNAEVGGDFYLHGIVRPVVLKVSVNHAPGDLRRLMFVATTTIHRSEFGITAATPIVADEIAIRVSTEVYDSE